MAESPPAVSLYLEDLRLDPEAQTEYLRRAQISNPGNVTPPLHHTSKPPNFPITIGHRTFTPGPPPSHDPNLRHHLLHPDLWWPLHPTVVQELPDGTVTYNSNGLRFLNLQGEHPICELTDGCLVRVLPPPDAEWSTSAWDAHGGQPRRICHIIEDGFPALTFGFYDAPIQREGVALEGLSLTPEAYQIWRRSGSKAPPSASLDRCRYLVILHPPPSATFTIPLLYPKVNFYSHRFDPRHRLAEHQQRSFNQAVRNYAETTPSTWTEASRLTVANDKRRLEQVYRRHLLRLVLSEPRLKLTNPAAEPSARLQRIHWRALTRAVKQHYGEARNEGLNVLRYNRTPEDFRGEYMRWETNWPPPEEPPHLSESQRQQLDVATSQLTAAGFNEPLPYPISIIEHDAVATFARTGRKPRHEFRHITDRDFKAAYQQGRTTTSVQEAQAQLLIAVRQLSVQLDSAGDQASSSGSGPTEP